jgi:hypothetical protein
VQRTAIEDEIVTITLAVRNMMIHPDAGVRRQVRGGARLPARAARMKERLNREFCTTPWHWMGITGR